MMQNIKIQLLLLSLPLLLISCNDFLDVDPNAYMTKEDIKTPKDVNLVLTGTYSSLTDQGLYKESMYLMGELRSDNAWCDQNSFYANLFRIEIDQFNITSLNQGISNHWQHHWRGVGRSNFVIETALAIDPSKQGNASLTEYIAEAQFLRALYMFNLVQAYGEIPVVKKLGSNIVEVDNHTIRPLSEIYEFIVDDLKSAAQVLPPKPKVTGRASKASAKALLGKVYLTMAGYPYNDKVRNPDGLDAAVCYTNALDALKELTSSDPLSSPSAEYGLKLLPIYQDLYTTSNKGNAEEIFSVQYLSGSGIGLGSPYPKSLGARDYQLNIPNSGDGQCVPTMDLIDTYRFTPQLDPYNDVLVASQVNTRDGRGVSVAASTAGTAFGQGCAIAATVKGKGANANYFTGKYMSKGSSIVRDADDNWYILRLADVLLMQSEILWEQGAYNDAIVKLNFLVTRANGGISNDLHKLPLYNAVDYDKEAGRKLIQDERRRELSFEGHRWFDLVRTNRYHDDASATNRSVTLMNTYFQKNYTNFLNGSTDKYAIIEKLIYITDNDLIYPIPPLEISLNPALKK